VSDRLREGLTITAIGSDENWEEYRIEASNGEFSGAVYIYAELGSAPRWAQALDGFPCNATDTRQLSCGWLGAPARAGGLVELRFSCTDPSGHAVLDIALCGELPVGGAPQERAQFRIKISAAGVDQLVKQLQSFSVELESIAHLYQA
jgi:hypothetical protein